MLPKVVPKAEAQAAGRRAVAKARVDRKPAWAASVSKAEPRVRKVAAKGAHPAAKVDPRVLGAKTAAAVRAANKVVPAQAWVKKPTAAMAWAARGRTRQVTTLMMPGTPKPAKRAVVHKAVRSRAANGAIQAAAAKDAACEFLQYHFKTLHNMADQEQSTGLLKLLEDQLADLYYVEKQLVKALPKMAEKANNEELRTAFQEHLEETQNQVGRQEEIFSLLEIPVEAKKCPAIDGILEEGTEIMEEFADDEALDAGLVSAGQKVEHYEICSYGCMKAWASQLGLDEVVALIDETLEEEKAADEKLTTIAETVVNIEAGTEGTEEAEETQTADGSDGAARGGRASKGARKGS